MDASRVNAVVPAPCLRLDVPLAHQLGPLLRCGSLRLGLVALPVYLGAVAVAVGAARRSYDGSDRLLFEDRPGGALVMLIVILVIMIAIPLIRLKKSIVKHVEAATRNEIIGAGTDSPGLEPGFSDELKALTYFSRTRLVERSALAVLLVAVTGAWLIMWLEGTVWMWLVFINLLACLIVFVQQLTVSAALEALFGRYRVTPRLLDRDNCSGFSPFGNLARNRSLVAAGMLIIVPYVAMAGAICACAPDMRNAIPALAAGSSVVLTAISFGLLTWGVHTRMCAAKADELERIAREIRPLVMARPDLGDIELAHRLEMLETRYGITNRGLAQWPFDFSIVRLLIPIGTLAAAAVKVVDVVLDSAPR